MFSPQWPGPRPNRITNICSTSETTKSEGASYARHYGHGGANPLPKWSNEVRSLERLEGTVLRQTSTT